MTTRTSTVRWEGGLGAGSGSVSASTSGALDALAVTWKARTEGATATSPEELIAAAHATCFAMSLAHILEDAQFRPALLDAAVTITLDRVDGMWTIMKSEIDIVGDVPAIDEATFSALAAQAKAACVVTRALAATVDVTVKASLNATQLAAAAGP